MKKKVIVLGLLVFFIISIVSAKEYSRGYNHPLTRSVANAIYCRFNGNCELDTLSVKNISITGHYLNVTVTDYNVTGEIYVDGNISSNMVCLDDYCIDGWSEVNITADVSTLIANSSNITTYYDGQWHLSYNGTVGGGSDGLGNHTAYMDLDMDNFSISDVNVITSASENRSGMGFDVDGGNVVQWLYE